MLLKQRSENKNVQKCGSSEKNNAICFVSKNTRYLVINLYCLFYHL